MIRMKYLINHNIWYWDDVKFFNRSYIIKVKIDVFEGLRKNFFFV
jgi:hypothetical protein